MKPKSKVSKTNLLVNSYFPELKQGKNKDDSYIGCAWAFIGIIATFILILIINIFK